jgi:TPR repeat protein
MFQVYDRAIDRAIDRRLRLKLLGCNGKVARLMSQGKGGPAERRCNMLMKSIMLRATAQKVDKSPEGLHAKALTLRAKGEYANAAALLQQAIDSEHVPSYVVLAEMLLEGQKGVLCDQMKAFLLLKQGERMGCSDCNGLLALCFACGMGCIKDTRQSLALACVNAANGCKYGISTLAMLSYFGEGGLEKNYKKAFDLFQIAALKDYYLAQFWIGHMFAKGLGVPKDLVQALRWYKLVADQGHPTALYEVGYAIQYSLGCEFDPISRKEKAFFFLDAATSAGHSEAARLKRNLTHYCYGAQ